MARIPEISDARKKLQGHSRFIKNSPTTKPISKLWPSQRDLRESGRAFHKVVGNLLVGAKVLTELDKFQWFELCYLYEQMHELREIIRNDGYIIKGSVGVKKNPAMQLFNTAFANFQKLSEKFGLTPFDRRKINLPVDKNPDDRLRRFIFGESD